MCFEELGLYAFDCDVEFVDDISRICVEVLTINVSVSYVLCEGIYFDLDAVDSGRHVV